MQIVHTTRRGTLVLALGFLALALGAFRSAEAQQPAPAARTYSSYYNTAAPAYPRYAYAAPAQPAGDPYGFTSWLNSVRAGYGLAPVGYDAGLSGWANANNAQQNSRGIGHFVMGPARRQNSAMGHYGQIGAMWLASPAHRAALLDPTIRRIGIAGMGSYWTFNAN